MNFDGKNCHLAFRSNGRLQFFMKYLILEIVMMKLNELIYDTHYSQNYIKKQKIINERIEGNLKTKIFI